MIEAMIVASGSLSRDAQQRAVERRHHRELLGRLVRRSSTPSPAASTTNGPPIEELIEIAVSTMSQR